MLSRSRVSTISSMGCGPREEPRIEPLQGVDDFLDGLRSARGTEDRAAHVENVADDARIQVHQVVTVGRDEPLQPVPDAIDVAYIVSVIQFQYDGADDVIEARAQPAAGNQGASQLARVEIDLAPRARPLKRRQIAALCKPLGHLLGVECDQDPIVVADKPPVVAFAFQVPERRGYFCPSQRGDDRFNVKEVHRLPLG